jgi:hypothetical protein
MVPLAQLELEFASGRARGDVHMSMSNAAVRTPAYDSNGVRVAPYSARDLFMMDPANGATWAERYRAWQAGAASRPSCRWLTANELADRAEAAEIAADNASMAR